MKTRLLALLTSSIISVLAKVEGTINFEYNSKYHLFTSSFLFGTPSQDLEMIFSLQNSFTYVVDKERCEGCTVYDNAFGYNRTASTTSTGDTTIEIPLNITSAILSSY